jgi:hypothetical protein
VSHGGDGDRRQFPDDAGGPATPARRVGSPRRRCWSQLHRLPPAEISQPIVAPCRPMRRAIAASVSPRSIPPGSPYGPRGSRPPHRTDGRVTPPQALPRSAYRPCVRHLGQRCSLRHGRATRKAAHPSPGDADHRHVPAPAHAESATSAATVIRLRSRFERPGEDFHGYSFVVVARRRDPRLSAPLRLRRQ